MTLTEEAKGNKRRKGYPILISVCNRINRIYRQSSKHIEKQTKRHTDNHDDDRT